MLKYRINRALQIVSESSVASGVRRIEAVTGNNIMKYIDKNNELIAETAKTLSLQIIMNWRPVPRLSLRSLKKRNAKYRLWRQRLQHRKLPTL